jgi:hypothetical protein
MVIRISFIQGKNSSYYNPKNVINSRIKSPHLAKGTVNCYVLYINGIEDLLINMMTPVFSKFTIQEVN